MAKLSLRVNGKNQTIDVEPDMPLLYALRDDLGLSNPRFGCGLGQCGACTVHIDGRPVRSCITPVSSVGERRITRTGVPVEDCVRASDVRRRDRRDRGDHCEMSEAPRAHRRTLVIQWPQPKPRRLEAAAVTSAMPSAVAGDGAPGSGKANR